MVNSYVLFLFVFHLVECQSMVSLFFYVFLECFRFILNGLE